MVGHAIVDPPLQARTGSVSTFVQALVCTLVLKVGVEKVFEKSQFLLNFDCTVNGTPCPPHPNRRVFVHERYVDELNAGVQPLRRPWWVVSAWTKWWCGRVFRDTDAGEAHIRHSKSDRNSYSSKRRPGAGIMDMRANFSSDT